MDHRRLAALDLNLLVILDALLEARNVGRAGRSVGLSQPATSRALARLREQLGDPLLVRSGNHMILTARAEALVSPLRRLLNGAAAVLEPPGAFDPAASTRIFVIATSDYVERVLLARALPSLRSEAPRVGFVVRPAIVDEIARAETGDVDLGLAPLPHDGPGLLRRRLWRDEFVLAFRRDHPLVKRTLTLKEYLRWPQILVSPEGRGVTDIDAALAERGSRRVVAYRTPSLGSALTMLAATDLVLNVPRLSVSGRDEIATADLPFACPALDIHLVRHERSTADAGLGWLAERLTQASLELGPPRR